MLEFLEPSRDCLATVALIWFWDGDEASLGHELLAPGSVDQQTINHVPTIRERQEK